jgi:hypothetical protein
MFARPAGPVVLSLPGGTGVSPVCIDNRSPSARLPIQFLYCGRDRRSPPPLF